MKNKTLDMLVSQGTLESYHYYSVDADGNPGRGDSRNSEELEMTFPDGTSITISCFCSGSTQDTILFVTSEEDDS